MRIKLTRQTLAQLARTSHEKQTIYRDTVLQGFGVRATKYCMTFIVEKKAEGRSVRISIGSVLSVDLDEARRRALEILANLQDRIKKEHKTEPPTLAELIEHYLTENKTLRHSTRSRYQTLLNKFPAWQDKQITHISEAEILGGYLKLAENAPGSAWLLFSLLSALYTFAMNHPRYDRALEALCNKNPVSVLKRTKQRPRLTPRTDCLDTKEMKAAVAFLSNHQNRTAANALTLLLLTGARKREITELKYLEVNFIKRVISLPADRIKTKQPRQIPCTEAIMSILQEQATLRNPLNPHIFQGNGLNPIGRHHLEQAFRALQTELSRHDLIIHGLRRSYISFLSRQDVPDWAIKRIVGHQDRDMTSKYRQPTTDELRARMQEAEESLFSLDEKAELRKKKQI